MSTTNPNVCAVPSLAINALKEDISWWYTNMMTSFMRQLVSYVDDGTLKKVAVVFDDSSKGSDVFTSTLFQNKMAVAIFFILLIVSIVVLLGIAGVCVLRKYYSTSEDQTPKTWQKIVTLVTFGLCVFVCLFGVVLFSMSIKHVRNGIELIPKQLSSTSLQIGEFVKLYGDNLECIYKKESDALDKSLLATLKTLFVHIDQQTNFQGISRTIERVQNRTKEVLQIVMKIKTTTPRHEQYLTKFEVFLTNMMSGSFSTNLTLYSAIVDDFKRTISSAKKDITRQKDKAMSMVKDQHLILARVIRNLRDGVADVQRFMQVAMAENNYSGKISFWLQFTVIVPIILILIVGMGFFYFTLRFFVHLAQLDKKEQEKDYPPDHILIIAKGLFGYGGYLAMVTAAVLFFMAAMCFVTALVSVFFCEAVFRDEDLRLFPHINKLEHVEKIKGVEFKVSVRDAMVNCRSGFTFFDAIDGNEIMAKQTLKKDLRNLRPKNLDKILTQKTVPVLVVKSVEETHSQIRNISRQLISVEPTYPELKPLSEAVMSLRRVLIRLSEHVRQMRIRSVREDIFYAIESNFVEMETSIIKAVALFIKMLLDLSPQCSNLISIWDDIGNYICDQIVTPIQGIWMACVICGLGALISVWQLFNSTKYLNQTAKKTDPSVVQQENTEKQKHAPKAGTTHTPTSSSSHFSLQSSVSQPNSSANPTSQIDLAMRK